MPGGEWESLTVRNDTGRKADDLKGCIVEVGGTLKELRTDDDVVAAGIDLLAQQVKSRPATAKSAHSKSRRR